MRPLRFGRSDDDARGDGAAGGDSSSDGTPSDGAVGPAIRYRMDNDPSTGSIPATLAGYNATCTLCPCDRWPSRWCLSLRRQPTGSSCRITHSSARSRTPWGMGARRDDEHEYGGGQQGLRHDDNRNVFNLIVRRTDNRVCSRARTRPVARPTVKRRTRSRSTTSGATLRRPGTARPSACTSIAFSPTPRRRPLWTRRSRSRSRRSRRRHCSWLLHRRTRRARVLRSCARGRRDRAGSRRSSVRSAGLQSNPFPRHHAAEQVRDVAKPATQQQAQRQRRACAELQVTTIASSRSGRGAPDARRGTRRTRGARAEWCPVRAPRPRARR